MTGDRDSSDEIWATLKASSTGRAEALRRILDEVRRTQNIPLRSVALELPKVAALLEQAEASPVDEMDQIKIIGRLQENYRALEFLREWAKTISPVTAHKAQEIMALRPAGDNLSERLDSCRRRVELLLLSHPSGREFWGLARVLMKDIVAELQQADAHAAAALRQWRDTIHWVAPSWVFEDQSTDGANSKYSYRPIAVKRIVPGGLPGQGRR